MIRHGNSSGDTHQHTGSHLYVNLYVGINDNNILSCAFPALLLSCPFPVLLLSSDEVGEAKVNELPNANAWLFDGIAVSTASIRIPAKAKGRIIIAIGLCTVSSTYKSTFI
jgi:hypothetical protein